jgi:hypothetical protein
VGDTTSLVPGFPIRTSSDPRSVDNSPRHIAASHVLHRLPVPRHPPCALTHLQTQKPIDIEKNCTSTHQTNPACQMLATTIHKSNTTPHHQREATTTTLLTHRSRTTGLLSQSPIVCLAVPTPQSIPVRLYCSSCTQPGPLQTRVPSRHRRGPLPPPVTWCSLERR